MSNIFNKIDVESILNRVKSVYKLKSDADVARFFDVSRATPSSWRKRNTIDFQAFVTRCRDQDLNWLILGEKKAAASEEAALASEERSVIYGDTPRVQVPHLR